LKRLALFACNLHFVLLLKLVRPYARDECILWKCDFEHKAWKKTNVTENYELFTECVDKCELDLITQWINSWLKDILKDQKMMKDGKKSKKGLSCCFK
ncbi:hypothetical protein M514_07016, partial [Trichuris suis]